MTKILVTGTTTYSDNRGVSAMAASTVKILRKFVPNAEIVIWHSESSKRSSPTTYETDVKLVRERSAAEFYLKIPVRLLLCLMWRAVHDVFGDANVLMGEKLLKEYRDADLIVSLNFGDGFTDNYGMFESATLFSQNLLNHLSKKPVVYFPQSIGTFNTKPTRWLAKALLNRSKSIMVREKITKEYLKSIGVKKALVRSIPDTAFLLEPVEDALAKKILSDEGLQIESKKPIIGISVNPFIAQFSRVPEKREAYLDTMAKFIDHFVERMGAVVVFVPNVTFPAKFDTRSLANLIRDRTKHKESVVSIKGEYTAEELKGIIKQCDLFVGSLMHTVIASVSMNVPSIAIAYSHKAFGIMEMVGLGDYVVHFRDLSLDVLVAKAEKAWADREKIRRDLEPRTKQVKEQVLASGELVRELLSR